MNQIREKALGCFLKGYDGTVLLVSRNRTFVERTADRIYSIEGQTFILKS